MPEQTVPEQTVPEQTVPEQTVPERTVPATVSAFHPDGSAVVLRDDGLLVDVDAAAVRLGGWRFLRPGQRVRLLGEPGEPVRKVAPPC